jgi:hypothetical protein
MNNNLYFNSITNKKIVIEKLILDEDTKIVPQRKYYDKGIKELVLNEGLEIIGDGAFRSNKLTKLVLNKNLKSIGFSAFSSNQIEMVEFNEGLEVISGFAFRCNNLNEIKLPSTVREIGIEAFTGNNIKHVILPDNITKIEQEAFDSNVSFTYKEIYFDSEIIKKYNISELPKLAFIKSKVPNVNFDNLSKTELHYLPMDTDLVKGFFNNKKRFNKLKDTLKIYEGLNVFDNFDLFIPSEYDDLLKVCLTLGYFNSNGEKLDFIESKIIHFYNVLGKTGIYKSFGDILKIKYHKKFAEVVLENNNIYILPQVVSSFYNRYDEISKGIIKYRQKEITKLNTARKKLIEKNLDTKEVDETLKVLKKNLKRYTLEDVMEYINNNTFLLNGENPEMENIIPYIVGKVNYIEFNKLDELLSTSKKCKPSNFKLLEGSKEEMNFKWLDHKDPLNLALGYIVDCCAKIKGAGEDIMIQSMINPNIKNLVIYNKDKLVAKTTAFYNNDYILCNNIEVAHTFLQSSKTTNDDLEKLCEIILEALKLQAEELNVSEVRIGMLRNDLAENLTKLALKIEHKYLLNNYKYKNYDGDANDREAGQAIVYKKGGRR